MTVSKFKPTQFGKYYLTQPLAVGGMAELFKATLYGISGFEKPMVIKQILPEYARNAEFIKMFIDEAKIAVRLSHGNVVPVYELGRIDNVFFIAMEYVHGKDLAAITQASADQNLPMSVEHAIYITIEICKGLAYAHRQTDQDGKPLGIVHRDICPPNILASYEGEVKIADFGIAKGAHKMGNTAVGALKGTYGYLSPEQAQNKELNHQTDIFTTGTLLHEMLTGRTLFAGKNIIEAMNRIRECEVAPPSALNPAVPWELDPIVLKALAKDQKERYTDATHLQLDLSRFLFSFGGGATAASLSKFLKKLFPIEAGSKANDTLPPEQSLTPEPALPFSSVEDEMDETSVERTFTFAVREDFQDISTGVRDRKNIPGNSQQSVKSQSTAPGTEHQHSIKSPSSSLDTEPQHHEDDDVSREETISVYDEDAPTDVYEVEWGNSAHMKEIDGPEDLIATKPSPIASAVRSAKDLNESTIKNKKSGDKIGGPEDFIATKPSPIAPAARSTKGLNESAQTKPNLFNQDDASESGITVPEHPMYPFSKSQEMENKRGKTISSERKLQSKTDPQIATPLKPVTGMTHTDRGSAQQNKQNRGIWGIFVAGLNDPSPRLIRPTLLTWFVVMFLLGAAATLIVRKKTSLLDTGDGNSRPTPIETKEFTLTRAKSPKALDATGSPDGISAKNEGLPKTPKSKIQESETNPKSKPDSLGTTQNKEKKQTRKNHRKHRSKKNRGKRKKRSRRNSK